MKRVLMYKRFERFWHWAQAVLVLMLAFTGFNIHGTFDVVSYEQASEMHGILLWLLLGLWAFAIFWHFTTGEWKNYIPTTEKLGDVIRYYSSGIFKGEEHPYEKTPEKKLNPLQRIAYLKLKLIINPGLIISGLLYLFYNEWPEAVAAILSLEIVALIHTAFAFFMVTFVIVHVYLITTGHTVGAHLKSMVTGYEDIPDHKGAE
ncbi:Cytochrome B561 [Candidatus Terasakiella magnetica]|uniref:Cytochrome B561 n=1 Tax=Candidatus Terasakiella magnetica TaxID=1867952 RepID=A0A1C3REY2_9PROT|nr:cytochrome b/b6 domain-containing protein [Candidatus Terasakiella magnetica]SCA55815.1 Cytochrome B561 [Candidatus Terasakiella magnetica]